jgi:hypothetical protein
MKAISLWQPWAVLFSLGAKTIRNQALAQGVRGQQLIHAAKKCDREILVAVNELAPVMIPFGIHGPADLSFGAIIGRVQRVACLRMRHMPLPSENERVLGDWAPDRYTWEFAKPELCRAPIRYRRSQGFFDVPEEALPA